MLTEAIQNHGATLKRGLGLLLVVFILYGTTVEAAHRHGVITQSNSATSLTNTDAGGNGTFSAKPGCHDCLICQLHQNFAATLITVKLNTAPIARVTHAQRFDPVSSRSIVNSPQTGRAPPQAN